MKQETIQVFNLEKTLKANPYILSYEIVEELIKNQYGIKEKDFHKLKQMLEEGSYKTFCKVIELTTVREGKLYLIKSYQDLSIDYINKNLRSPSNECHFFGEMDLNLTWSKERIYKHSFKISEACGYFVESWKNAIILFGSYEPHKFILTFDKETKKLIKITDKSYKKNKTYDVLKGFSSLPKGIGYKQGYFY